MIGEWIAAFCAVEVIPRQPEPDQEEPIIPAKPVFRPISREGVERGQRPFTGSSSPVVTKLYKHSPRRRRRY